MKTTAIGALHSTQSSVAPRRDEISRMLLNLAGIAIGIAIILAALNDVFQSVVMPRATGRRFRVSFYVWRITWRIWPRVAWQLYPRDDDRREDLLAVFAPFMLLALFAIWVSLLIIGFGFVLWGLRAGIAPADRSFGTMLYFAGTSVLTIGYGDVVARASLPRFFSVMAALAGLSSLSITTAYLFAIFGSFQNRETFVVSVAARGGTPSSGVNLVAIAGYSRTKDDLPALMIDAQRWAAAVMESHLAYPVLAFFRSSHDDESWVGTLGTLLDAATLLMTTVDGVRDGQARIFYNVGRHAARDLARYFRVGDLEESAGIERAEFEHACERLVAAGYTLHDLDESWKQFSALRAGYASRLNALAAFFQIPPLQWIGDRSTLHVSPHKDLKIHDLGRSGGENV